MNRCFLVITRMSNPYKLHLSRIVKKSHLNLDSMTNAPDSRISQRSQASCAYKPVASKSSVRLSWWGAAYHPHIHQLQYASPPPLVEGFAKLIGTKPRDSPLQCPSANAVTFGILVTWLHHPLENIMDGCKSNVWKNKIASLSYSVQFTISTLWKAKSAVE